jgi:hypothetical protein
VQDLLGNRTYPEGEPMHLLRRLRQHRPRSARIAVFAVAAAAAGLLVPQSANAAGTNWAQYSGNCYGWTTWDANYVTGHVWDHANDQCEITIFQYQSNHSPEWPDSVSSAYATAVNTGATTPTWYHGMTSSGTGLSDYVCVTDLTTGSPGYCSPTYS